MCWHPYIYCKLINNTFSRHTSVTVVVLETLNSALQKQESLSSNGKVIQAKKIQWCLIIFSSIMLIQCLQKKCVTIVSPCVSCATSQPPSPAVEPGSSSDDVESVLGQESSQNCKRKRSTVETGLDRNSDTDSRHQFNFQFLMCLSFLLISFFLVFMLAICSPGWNFCSVPVALDVS